MATTAQPLSTLERFKQLDAASLLLIHLISEFPQQRSDTDLRSKPVMLDAPFEGLLDDDLMSEIGGPEYEELFAHSGTDHRQHPSALEIYVLVGRLFGRLAQCSPRYFSARADHFLGLAQHRAGWLDGDEEGDA